MLTSLIILLQPLTGPIDTMVRMATLAILVLVLAGSCSGISDVQFEEHHAASQVVGRRANTLQVHTHLLISLDEPTMAPAMASTHSDHSDVRSKRASMITLVSDP